jgi:glyoxylase-like metal-dependent hydrolase (beta-lactamase superfamily II)
MVGRMTDWGDDERRLTPSVSVLVGDANGAYPSGNTLLIRGAGESVLIDPSVTVVARGGAPVAVDAVINSHSHEDHMAGNGTFPDARLHIHDHDLPGARSMEGLMEVYGLTGDARDAFEKVILEEFHYVPRPDAQGFTDGDVFDLGGGVRVEAVHLPGHTRGHSGFRMDEVFFLSDIDLTGFGPYYGDVWSDLEDFEASLAKVRDEDAAFYVTFHHKGVIEGRDRFVELIDAFTAVIGRRHDAMLEFLREPRSVDDMRQHRFIYRPHVEMPFVESVERRSAALHVQRMLRRGEATEVAPGRFQSAP